MHASRYTTTTCARASHQLTVPARTAALLSAVRGASSRQGFHRQSVTLTGMRSRPRMPASWSPPSTSVPESGTLSRIHAAGTAVSHGIKPVAKTSNRIPATRVETSSGSASATQNMDKALAPEQSSTSGFPFDGVNTAQLGPMVSVSPVPRNSRERAMVSGSVQGSGRRTRWRRKLLSISRSPRAGRLPSRSGVRPADRATSTG